MPTRSGSLDAMRGLAVLFMLEVHLGYWWARSLPPGSGLVAVGTVLGGTAAPVFLMLAGTGLALSHDRRPAGFLERSARRGVALLAIGIVFTFLEQAVYGPFGWGVLQCIGVSVILCAPAMRAPPYARAVAGIAIMAVAPVLRWSQGVPDVLYSNDMTAVSSIVGYLRGMMLSGFFPLFPWTGLMLLGTAAGDWLGGMVRAHVPAARDGPGAGSAAAGRNAVNGAPVRNVAWMAIFLIVAGTALLARGVGPEFFPPSLSFTFLVSGICLLAMPLFLAAGFPEGNALSALGRISLTVFVVHHFIGYEAFRAAGLLYSLDVSSALAMVLLAWALALLAAWAWSRAGFRFSLEWAVGLLEGGPSKKDISSAGG